MASNQNNLESQKQGTPKSSKGLIILFIIVIMILAVVIAVLVSRMNDQQAEAQQTQELLEQQRVVLEQDLTDLQYEFGNLKTNNDSLQNLAAEQQQKIDQLLKVQADNAYKIKMYTKELATLREVLKSYIIQVDSLNQRNQILVAENNDLNRDLRGEKARSAQLSADKEQLTTEVAKAKVLSVSNIVSVGLNNKGKENQRVRNIVRLRTCFTLRANAVATAGERVVYVAIVKPDKTILKNPKNDVMLMEDGSTQTFSAKRTVDYDKKDVEICIFTEVDDRLEAGDYTARIYCEGVLLGTSAPFSFK